MTAARPRRAARLVLAAGLAGLAVPALAEAPAEDVETPAVPAAAAEPAPSGAPATAPATDSPAPAEPAAAPAAAAESRAELARIRAELERLEARQRELRAALAALATRLGEPAAVADPDADGAAASASPAEPVAAAPDEPARPSPAARYRDPAPRLFDRARAAFAELNFYDAERLFGEFLERYPEHEQAAHAHYWLGETRYAQGRFRSAVDEFEALLARPAGPWHPVARLKIGYAWFELGDYARARAVLTELRAADPGGNIARLAQLRLERLARLAPELFPEP